MDSCRVFVVVALPTFQVIWEVLTPVAIAEKVCVPPAPFIKLMVARALPELDRTAVLVIEKLPERLNIGPPVLLFKLKVAALDNEKSPRTFKVNTPAPVEPITFPPVIPKFPPTVKFAVVPAVKRKDPEPVLETSKFPLTVVKLPEKLRVVLIGAFHVKLLND